MCGAEDMSPVTPLNSTSCMIRSRTHTDHTPTIAPQGTSRQCRRTRASPRSKKPPREELMSKTRISTMVRLAIVQKIRKSTGSHPGIFLSLCRQGAGATARSAALMLIGALLAVSPSPMSAATPDPVLEWIGVMNTTVLTAGTAPNVTSRVVALVSASVFDAVNGIEPRFRPLHVRPDAPRHASQCDAAGEAAYALLIRLYPA